MIKIDQINQIHSEDNIGDCLSACVCSLLEIADIESVPNFAEYGTSYKDILNEFLSDKGYFLTETLVYEHDGRKCINIIPNNLGIGIGTSPRGDFTHAVIVDPRYCKMNVLHDPHKSREGVLDIQSIKYIMSNKRKSEEITYVFLL